MLSNAVDRLGAKSNDAVKRRVSEIGARSQQKLCATWEMVGWFPASLLSDSGNLELICKVCTFY